ncbi:WXG100 family type VII secretion target [Actinokineospora pegani]|uniref:WXG100 family type VII secretion target n=1 Tax=Actinokineospora pegani TaxID=2654637 RepID=UPI0012EAD884|nr:hypothetical protein [Actinokineospora pegani]
MTDVLTTTTLLDRLRSTRAAVEGGDWVSGALAASPEAPLSLLADRTKPLSALDSGGIGFLAPMIAFLEEPLEQLRGDPGPVSSGADDFGGSARDTAAVAEDYRASAAQETDSWSGAAGTGYLERGSELADGVLSLAETALTTAKSLIGAGTIVATLVAEVTAEIGKALGEIVPRMATALAQAPATFGASIAEAIPECVGIAARYAAEVAKKVGDFLASGENLVELIDGAIGVLKLVKQTLTLISEQSTTATTTEETT